MVLMLQLIFKPIDEPEAVIVAFILEGPSKKGTKFELTLKKKNKDKKAEIRELDVHACFKPKRKCLSFSTITQTCLCNMHQFLKAAKLTIFR